ncbi:MAG: helix-turn-helix domain-containing protein [Defluviitaleaceae bacterium]|nr:helix-turn-helix domain-containing protein [Defluviitaleaceae bacterium]
MDNLGGKLKKLRLEKGVTQKQIADYLGVASHSVQRFEYGTNNPSLENIVKLAEFFEVSTDYLLGVSDNPQRQ